LQARDFVEEKQKARDRCKTALLKNQNLRESLPSELKILRQNLRSIETAISSATTKAERILEKRPGKNAISDLEKLVERISTLESQYEAAADRFHDAQEAESQARENLKEQEHEFKLLTRQLGALEKGVAEKTAKLKALTAQLRGQPDLRALSEERKQLEKAKKQKETYDSQRKQEEATFSAAEKLRVTAEAELSGLQARLKELDASIATARASGDRLEQRIRSELSLPKGVDEVKELESRRISLEKRSRDLAGHVARKRAELESLVQALADLVIKGKQLQDLKARADLFHELGVALKADQFIRFIVEEALIRLAAYGTEHLRRLSLDRYAFATETDDFAVIDHWNADESRSVNTLSGGESFVASLSLALALSDALAELSTDHTTSRLDSLFLDEGFSTLDPETLDVSVQAVEALAGGDRLVGIISHVPELAERFPCRIEVKKAIGGSTLNVTGNESQMLRSTTA
jgi:exonuclease SbcC